MTQPARAVSLLTLPLLVNLTLLFAGPASPPVELRLPADIVLDRAGGADGAVVFRHATHAAFTGIRCQSCHPAPFRMLKAERSFTHEKMNAGQQCGVCHDGTKSFSTADDKVCGRCHNGFGPPQTPYPPDVAIQGGGRSPGMVVFRHATHAERSGCADCHPRPFLTRAARAAAALAAPAAGHETCSTCHDGKSFFGVEDEGSCERCHAPAQQAAGGAP